MGTAQQGLIGRAAEMRRLISAAARGRFNPGGVQLPAPSGQPAAVGTPPLVSLALGETPCRAVGKQALLLWPASASAKRPPAISLRRQRLQGVSFRCSRV